MNINQVHVHHLDVKKGDIVVVRTAKYLSPNAVAQIGAQLNAVFTRAGGPIPECLILGPGETIEIVRPAASEDVKAIGYDERTLRA